MIKWLLRQLKRRPKPLQSFWRWAGRADSRKGRIKRWRALKQLAAHRAKAAHHLKVEAADRKDWRAYRKHKRTEERWFRTRTVYRRQQRRAYRRWKKHQQQGQAGVPKYEPWQLSANSGNIDDQLKPVVAFLVVVRKQWITDTYDYSGHTPTSLHYPRNDPTPPQQGRAVDAAGSDMCGAATALAAKFNDDLLELFSPCGWYIKTGTRYSNPGGGPFPGHGDHIHAGRD